MDEPSQQQQHRFHVRSLGWTTIDEDDLTTERSSRSVNRCIYELTRGINDAIGRWGEGKDLYMDINSTDLLLIDPAEMTILHKQSIPSIRVWGVGRENSRFNFDQEVFRKRKRLFFVEILPMLLKTKIVPYASINVMFFDVIILQLELLRIHYVISAEI